jgi:hypothetical protein
METTTERPIRALIHSVGAPPMESSHVMRSKQTGIGGVVR